MPFGILIHLTRQHCFIAQHDPPHHLFNGSRIFLQGKVCLGLANGFPPSVKDSQPGDATLLLPPATRQPHLPAGSLLPQGDSVMVLVLLQQAGPAHAAAFCAAVQPLQLAMLLAQAALEIPHGLQQLVVPEHLLRKVAVLVLLAQGGRASRHDLTDLSF